MAAISFEGRGEERRESYPGHAENATAPAARNDLVDHDVVAVVALGELSSVVGEAESCISGSSSTIVAINPRS